ncbi:MAG: hypothetical protein WED34_02180 [Planctomycetales bacterium]
MAKWGQVLRRCLFRPIVVWLLFAAVAAVPGSLSAAPAAEPPERPVPQGQSGDLGEYLLAALWQSRDLLRTLCYSASETLTVEPVEGGAVETTARIEAAFDYENRRYRVIYLHASDAERNRAWIEDPEKVVTYSKSTGYAIIEEADKASRRRPDGFLDVRNLGILSSSEVRRHVFYDVREALEESSRLEGFEGAEKTYTLIMRQGEKHPWERRIILDAKSDYAPTRLEIRYKDSGLLTRICG